MVKAPVSASPTTPCCAMSSLVRYRAILSLSLAQSRSASLFAVTMSCPSCTFFPDGRLSGLQSGRAPLYRRPSRYGSGQGASRLTTEGCTVTPQLCLPNAHQSITSRYDVAQQSLPFTTLYCLLIGRRGRRFCGLPYWRPVSLPEQPELGPSLRAL